MTTKDWMSYRILAFVLAGIFLAREANAQQITAPVRVHLLTSADVPELNCSYTDAEIREIFVEVNKIWAQAEIHWEVESIVREPALEQKRFRKAFALSQQEAARSTPAAGNWKSEDLPRIGSRGAGTLASTPAADQRPVSTYPDASSRGVATLARAWEAGVMRPLARLRSGERSYG